MHHDHAHDCTAPFRERLIREVVRMVALGWVLFGSGALIATLKALIAAGILPH